MPRISLYLQLHQPYRLADFSVFDIGNNSSYFDDAKALNREVFQKVSQKSYLPMLSLLYDLIKRYPDFKFALSCSGVFLEQAQEYQPEVIELLKKMASTGSVEFLAETYYHSLASLYSTSEFNYQVYKHLELIHNLFGLSPKVFRNTELIYSNHVARLVADLKFKGMLTEAVDRYLGGRDRTQLFVDFSRRLPLMLKHAPLSDDIAFRFSDKNWDEHPLTVERYLRWVEVYPEEHFVNLFMDFETFGEHQWSDTGIFQFFDEFVKRFLMEPYNSFVNPSEVFSKLEPVETSFIKRSPLSTKTRVGFESYDLPVYDVPNPISWADVDRDITAWVDNPYQQDTIRKIYELREAVLSSGNVELQNDWRRLQISDHFYYMCTKWSADGDVHAYFSPYEDPHEAYRKYSLVLADIRERLGV